MRQGYDQESKKFISVSPILTFRKSQGYFSATNHNGVGVA